VRRRWGVSLGTCKQSDSASACLAGDVGGSTPPLLMKLSGLYRTGAITKKAPLLRVAGVRINWLKRLESSATRGKYQGCFV